MANQTGNPRSAAQESPETPLRVILVGRTGLDGRLRLDPAVELVRVGSRLEAIGELAEQEESEPPASVVIVGSESAELDQGAPGDGEFVAALRRVDPNVRILAATPQDRQGQNGFDAVVRPDAAAEALRRAVRGTSEPAPPPPQPSPSTPGSPGAEVKVASGTPTPGSAPTALIPQESDLIGVLLRGRDPVPSLVYRIAARLNDPTVEFLPHAGAADPGVPVVWAGRRLGTLRGRAADSAALAREAQGLAAWIALRDQQAALREAAFTDPLTGAHNRRYFERFLATALDDARGARRSVTVLLFDVDDFKTYNDRYGHAAGDEILREAVRLIRSVVRPTDKICRIGGDEFAVIFHDPAGPRTPTSRPPADVFQIARRFQAQVAAHRFPKLGSEAPGALTISGGLAVYPWDGRTPEELVARADALALESKRQGKNAIRFGPAAEAVGRGEPDA